MTDLGRLDAAWQHAFAGRAPHVSWSVSEGDRVLTARAPERWFASASMIKTFLAAVAVEAGEPSLDAPVTVRAEHRAFGDGVLGTFVLPVTLPLLELLRLMLAISDNTATNALLAALGGPEPVNARLAAWGYESRICGPIGAAGVIGGGERWSGADALTGRTGELPTAIGLGMTSVAEHGRLVAGLPADGVVLALLGEQQDRAGLARYVGVDVAFAHKTGSIAGVRHDAGLLRAGGRELLVGCFTDGGPEPEWVEHPAQVGMGLALAWTAELLGIDVEPPPGVAPCPL